eukprot:CAMPEP_0116011566 /NCGR_PEP_ID=MMETSP0321-20121206/4638_1 /TAXON_ID=163516 /ORGANISM="Leptocylindrus danicus var. danicus, Strain B650" /LENGTH=382 /DNA_ID=CAMNT_0003480811 /DNA_START=286 /DNA_END=1434 /DNA_ORIENTATION=+
MAAKAALNESEDDHDSTTSSSSSHTKAEVVEEEPLDSTSEEDESEGEDVIQIPFPLQMPKSLSPSSAAEFKNCPQSYFFQYILKIKQPTTEALAKGTMCHTALEQLFDLKPADRTLETLHNLMRKAWAEARDAEPYNILFKTDNGAEDDERDLEAERKWGTEALRLLSNYFKLEDPRHVKPDPVRREMWVKANLTTNYDASSSANSDDGDDDDVFLMRGIIDRLDLTRLANGDVGLRVTDYKTGKAPNFKYSRAMNKKIADEAMWQLKIYALLLREMNAAKVNGRSNNGGEDIPGVDLRMLRLLYLNSVSGQGQYLDFDLGETQEERDVVLNDVHSELSDIWRNIRELVNAQDPTLFEHCDRKFCFCHKLRPKFEKGTVFER